MSITRRTVRLVRQRVQAPDSTQSGLAPAFRDEADLVSP
jgi:hypothetical protein